MRAELRVQYKGNLLVKSCLSSWLHSSADPAEPMDLVLDTAHSCRDGSEGHSAHTRCSLHAQRR